MSQIELKALSKDFAGQDVLKGIDLKIYSEELLVILGASGGGKTTLLNIIAGLIPPSNGNILFDGRDVTHDSVAQRNIAYVFQDYALYPHMTVEGNIRFPLENMKLNKRDCEEKVNDTLKLLKLDSARKKYPSQLSGGQKQRVAIGRALVRDPAVFLFDEPLSSLDPQLRDHLRVELKQLHRQLKKTFVYVTHDQLSAMILGDRIAFLADKTIQQVASPDELYNEPLNVQVAEFLGFPPVNLIPRENIPSLAKIDLPDGSVKVGIRPERLHIEANAQGKFQIDWVQKVGFANFAWFFLGEQSVCARCDDHLLTAGQRIDCNLEERFLMFFDANEIKII